MNETICVTGAGGFVGNAIVNACAAERVPFVGIVRDRIPASVGSVRRLDLTRDVEGLVSAIKQARATILIHCAFSDRPAFETNPAAATAQATAIDHTVIAAVNRSDIRRVVVVGSSAVYGLQRAGEQSLAESREPAPASNYGRAKLAQERQFSDGIRHHQLTIAREFNVTGPGEPATNVGGAFAARLIKADPGDRLPLRNSEAVRDFSDVRDAAGAILGIATSDTSLPGVVNVCSGVGTTVANLARMIITASGKEAVLDPDGLGADSVSVGDQRLLTRLTGWHNRFPLTEAAAAAWNTAEAFATT